MIDQIAVQCESRGLVSLQGIDSVTREIEGDPRLGDVYDPAHIVTVDKVGGEHRTPHRVGCQNGCCNRRIADHERDVRTDLTEPSAHPTADEARGAEQQHPSTAICRQRSFVRTHWLDRRDSRLDTRALLAPFRGGAERPWRLLRIRLIVKSLCSSGAAIEEAPFPD